MLAYRAFRPPAQGKGEFQRESRLVAFVVRSDRPIERIELGPMAPIEKAIDEWRPILTAGKVKLATGDPARALRGLIWEPLEPHLEGVDSVLVSPDGPIGMIPLAALPGKEPGSYLIEERSIAVVPVPRVLGSDETGPAPSQRTDPGKAAPARSLLLVGDIDYGGDAGARVDRGASRSAAVDTWAGFLPFERLSATQAEIGSIGSEFRKRFPGAEELELDGVQATEEALGREAPRHRFLHLATHGYFAPKELRSALGPDDPQLKRPGIDALGGAGVVGYHPGLLSGIVLAGANVRPTPIDQDDGILTASEVAELDLSGVDLAVLSACETGLGEVAGGEGLLGLQRAFQEAGAGSVVASLWQVDDERTRALMTRFYENQWGKEGLQPAAALREAQLSMLRGEGQRRSGKGEQRGADRVPVEGADTSKSDRLPPFYWAAFVLSTDRP
ncbi:MAG: CHAT domain-containing protein [Isosphaeraceae bacterium]